MLQFRFQLSTIIDLLAPLPIVQSYPLKLTKIKKLKPRPRFFAFFLCNKIIQFIHISKQDCLKTIHSENNSIYLILLSLYNIS